MIQIPKYARFNAPQIRAMRALLASGASARSVARSFRCAHDTVRNIRDGITYPEIGSDELRDSAHMRAVADDIADWVPGLEMVEGAT